jgi:16S rRNA processing protein RimM
MKIRPQTNNPTLLLDITDVQIVGADGSRTAAEVKDLKLDRRMIFLSLKDYPDRTAVEHFVNADVFVDREQLRDLGEDEWWISDLVGLKAFSVNGNFVGTICSVVDSGNQLLEIVEPEGKKTALVPFVTDLVPVVDIKAGRVEIRDIPGLLEFS